MNNSVWRLALSFSDYSQNKADDTRQRLDGKSVFFGMGFRPRIAFDLALPATTAWHTQPLGFEAV